MKFLKLGWIPGLSAVLLMVLTISLGNWQMHRAEQKQTLQAALVAAEQTPAVTLAVTPSDWQQTAALIHQHLKVSGNWLPEAVVYLDNRSYEGRAGFYVLMPLRLDDGPGSKDQVLIVNRGWLPRDATDRTRLPPYSTPAGKVTLEGVALAEEPRLFELGQGENKLGGIWQNFDVELFERASGLKTGALVLRQQAGQRAGQQADAEADGLIRDWPDQGASIQGQIDRHHGYATQWYGLAALIVFLTLFYGYRNARKPNESSADPA